MIGGMFGFRSYASMRWVEWLIVEMDGASIRDGCPGVLTKSLAESSPGLSKRSVGYCRKRITADKNKEK